jgi:hypothetical protein
MKNINVAIQADGQTVVVDVPELKLTLNAADLDNMIAALSAARRNIKPEPALQPVQQQQVLATANPHFTVQTDEATRGVNVGIRDLGTGWQWYHFSEEHVGAFADALRKHLGMIPQDQRTLN